MKKMLLIVMLAMVPALASAQIFMDQNFGGDFPPAGWAADSHPENWMQSVSNHAGGAAPEAEFNWSPQITSGTTRFMSPRIDLTGVTTLKLQFREYIDHYTTPYTIGVATRHGSGAWTSVYSLSPTANVGPIVIARNISNADVGAADFQICWYFTGNSYNINFWYFDDIVLYQPLAHDIKVNDILVNAQYNQNAVYTPRASIVNFGLNPDTCNVKCEILNGQNVLYTDTLFNVALTAGQTSTVTFPNFTIPGSNQLYLIRVTSLLPGDMNPANDTLAEYFNTYTTPRNMVMTEIATGTWCTYCPGAAMGAEDMIDAGFNTAIVEYHEGSSTPDPFENPFSVARIAYYGVSGFPTAVFDGVLQFVGGNHTTSMFSNYQPLFQQRANVKSAFSMSISGSHAGDSLHIRVQVTKNAAIAYQDMVLHLVLTESNISYSWEDQDHVSFVERIMLPDEIGAALDFNSGDVQNMNFDFELDPSWDLTNCELAAFVQNLPDREVLQGAKVAVLALPEGVNDDVVALPMATKLVGNYPNPFNPSTTIEFALSKPGNVKLDLFNVLGQKVTTLVDTHMDAGNHSVIWDGRDASGKSVASGAYFYRLNTDDYTSTKKMVLAK